MKYFSSDLPSSFLDSVAKENLSIVTYHYTLGYSEMSYSTSLAFYDVDKDQTHGSYTNDFFWFFIIMLAQLRYSLV